MKPLLTKQDNIQFFQNPDLTTDQLSDGSRLKSQTSKSVLCVLDDIDINFLQKRCHQNPEISTE